MDKFLNGVIVNEIYSQFPYCVVDIHSEIGPSNCNDIIVKVHFLHLGNKKGIVTRFSEQMFIMSRDRAAFIESFVKECVISEIEKLQEETV